MERSFRFENAHEQFRRTASFRFKLQAIHCARESRQDRSHRQHGFETESRKRSKNRHEAAADAVDK